MVANWYARAFGMKITAYMGPETGVRDRKSYLLTLNKLKIVITSALKPSTWDVNTFVTIHGDGVKRWAMEVENVENAYNKVISQKAIPVRPPQELTDENGTVKEAAIKLYDDCEIVFVKYDSYKGIFKPGFREFKPSYPINFEETGLRAVDHIVGNVRENEMQKWAQYLIEALDFEQYIYFGPGDISTKYSALLSTVVRSKDSKIRNPINEPYEGLKVSQIEEYIREYNGTGIQHIALSTSNIVETVSNLRKNGVEFLKTPSTYYDLLRQKMQELPEEKRIEENIDDLERNGILCDHEGSGYLLQLFTKPIGDRPTLFFEIIQRRKGASGFGQGNFQALFNSIELEQKKRGNLDR